MLAGPPETPRHTLEADGHEDGIDAGRWRPQPEHAVGEADPTPTWDEVATKYGRKIYSIAYRLTGDAEEAKDLSQDVFVRVYRNLDKYEPGTFEGWLYRITKNLFLDRLRRRRRARLEPLPEEEWGQPVDDAPGPEQRLEQGLLGSDIEQALTRLPPDFRTAVVLCDVQGLSYEEIATATGWPLGTVRSRIHRGRKLLRAHLATAAGREDTDA
ncbi:MAG: sigma-70 family RNA polymerase sigma factor [Actinomycetota bacterium]|nr:sigma-70 family RNA polymerase sigma factor [Actinomycetota bacterium]